MWFDKPNLGPEFSQLHPRVRKAAEDLDSWLIKKGLPQMTVTHVLRTPAMQESIYWEAVKDTLKCTEEIARQTARNKPSWHLWYCALDFRNKVYTPAQKADIFKQLRDGRGDSIWEILMHDVGRGDHFHLGYRDFSWRTKYASQHGA